MFKDTPAFSSFSVDDLGKAKAFYGETLGLEVLETSEGLNITLAGGKVLFVYPKPNHIPATFTILNFMVDNINVAVDALIEKGITFEQYDAPMKTDEKGIFRGDGEMGPSGIAWFEDPARNIIAVMTK